MEIGIYFLIRFLKQKKKMNNIAKPYHRVISYLIDVLIYNTPFLILVYWFSGTYSTQLFFNRLITFFALLLIFGLCLPFIKSYMVSSFGGTFGKILTGTEILSIEDNKISFWRAFLRNYLGYMVSGILVWLGFIWIFIDKDRRAWHDMIAGTYVKIVNKSMVLVGLIIMVVVFSLNVFLIKNSISNFKLNSDIYSQIIN